MIFFDYPSGRAQIEMAMDWKAANLPAGESNALTLSLSLTAATLRLACSWSLKPVKLRTWLAFF
ncbi:MAG: hypothetical protein DME75_01755 [Verrucomicrobia bacterium]|nr:MAG: hypothetical protein DME75_01755 [Verrucomicrobiota bacterium]